MDMDMAWHVHMCTSTYILHLHLHLHLYIYIHIYICIHIYIYIYISASPADHEAADVRAEHGGGEGLGGEWPEELAQLELAAHGGPQEEVGEVELRVVVEHEPLEARRDLP